MTHLFPTRERVQHPLVITKTSRGDEWFFQMTEIKGDFLLVSPVTWKEVDYLQSLELGVDIFAPWDGDGVLISTRVAPYDHRS